MKSRIGRGIGVMSIAAGIAVTGMSTAAHAVGDPVPLNNDSPGSSMATGTGSCDVYGLDDTASYWHFVLSQNPYAFESITLNIGGTTHTYMPGDYDTNGKVDQAFIKVPDGKSLSDLMISGSFANVTPDPYSSNVNFVLSHECVAGYEESTSSTEETTTTVAESSTTTAAPAVVISTPTSQASSEAPVVIVTPAAQPSDVGAQGAVPQDVSLPATGSRTSSGLEIGLGLLAGGLVLTALSRRRTANNQV
jgi:hypothetical protein